MSPMTLKEWLKGAKMTHEDFAKLVGIDRFRVSRLVNGHMRPNLDLALLIERKTSEKVPAETWVRR